MAHIIADRVADTSTTTGTGDFTVANAPPDGYETLNTVLSGSDTFDYMIQNRDANEWEVGVGTYSGSHVFVRTTVQQSSNADAAVNFSAGTKDVALVNSAYRIKNPIVTSITVGASVPFSDAAGTLTLQNVDALDATTEATIEAAMDTLPNLTRITASHTDYSARFINTQDAATLLEVARFEGDRATPGDGDSMQVGFYLSNDAGTQIEAARMTWTLSDVTAGTEDSALLWMLYTGGSPEYFLRLEPTTLSPASNNLIALGTSSVGWADLFLASGGVINFDNGDVTITHSSNALAIAGGVTALDASSTVGGSVIKTVGKETIFIPAAAMTSRTTNGAAAGTTELTTNDVMLSSLDFDQTTEEGAGFFIAMPKSWNESTVTFKPFWTAASGSGGVVWGLAAYAFSDDDALDTAVSGQQTSTDTLIATGDMHIGPESSAITIGGTPAEGDMVYFEITREVANGSDTLSGDAKLLGVHVYITTNASTDA